MKKEKKEKKKKQKMEKCTIHQKSWNSVLFLLLISGVSKQ